MVCFALAFDSEARLGAFLPKGSHYASLPGRELIAIASAGELGLVINPEVASASMLLPSQVLHWITASASKGRAVDTRCNDIEPAVDPPPDLVRALDFLVHELADIIGGAGVATARYLCRSPSPVLVLVDVDTAHRPVARRYCPNWRGYWDMRTRLRSPIWITANRKQ